MKLNDTPIEDFGLYLLKGHSHPSSSIMNKTVSVPGKPGAYHFGNEIGVRPFNLPLGVLEMTRSESQEKLRRWLETIFDTNGQVKPIKLSFDYEPDKYYTVHFDQSINPNYIHEYVKFNAPFVAHDPHAYSIVYADELNWGNEELTFQSYYLLGHEGSDGLTKVTSPTTLNLEVDGYNLRPTIEISGSADGLTLSNGTQSFTLSNFTDADWVIGGQNYTVTKNNQNAFADMQGDFLWLYKGQNDITVTGSQLDVNIYVKFRDQYL